MVVTLDFYKARKRASRFFRSVALLGSGKHLRITHFLDSVAQNVDQRVASGRIGVAHRLSARNPIWAASLLTQAAAQAAGTKNALHLLSAIAGLETMGRPVPRAASRTFNDLFYRSSGRRNLRKAAQQVWKDWPDSFLPIYIIATTLALDGKSDKAFRFLRNARRPLKMRTESATARLTQIWNVVDHRAKQNMDETDETLNFHPSMSAANLKDHKAVVQYLAVLREARSRDEYLDLIEHNFDVADTLTRARLLKLMLAGSRRRTANYSASYDRARRLFNLLLHFWEPWLTEDPATFDNQYRLDCLLTFFPLARELGYQDLFMRMEEWLIRAALRPSHDASLRKAVTANKAKWKVVTTLLSNPTERCLRELSVLFMLAPQGLYDVTEQKCLFIWLRLTGTFNSAHQRHVNRSGHLQNSPSSLAYADLLASAGRFQDARKVVRQFADTIVSSPDKLNFQQHWRLVSERMGELAFLSQTTEYFKSVKQRKRPKGVMFICAPNENVIRSYSLMTLIELKRRGWWIIPLVEGTLPNTSTGNQEVDAFIWRLSSNRARLIQKEGRSSFNLSFSGSVCRFEFKDIDLSHAMWEQATVLRRRYTVDFEDPSLQNLLTKAAEQTVDLLDIMEQIRQLWQRLDVPFAFLAAETHKLPNAAVRKFCDLYGSPDAFYCINSSIAYENYFQNFSSNISTRAALRNVTRHPTVRAAFMPPHEEFEKWYELNSDQRSEMLAHVAHVTQVKRSNTEASLAPEAAECARRVEEWRAQGGKVACAFGKVVCDQAVPFDGGPAHASMKHWLNHTIESARGSNTLLLIKPHPHELKHDIGLFVTEHFSDLIDVELPENVLILGHRWFNMEQIGKMLDLGLLWNGTTSVELGLMGVPVVICSHFGPTDYPVGVQVPNDAEHYRSLVRFEVKAENAPDITERSAAWICYLATDEVSVPYRYYARQVTNRVIYPPYWFEKDVECYFKRGDAHVSYLADIASNSSSKPPQRWNPSTFA